MSAHAAHSDTVSVSGRDIALRWHRPRSSGRNKQPTLARGVAPLDAARTARRSVSTKDNPKMHPLSLFLGQNSLGGRLGNIRNRQWEYRRSINKKRLVCFAADPSDIYELNISAWSDTSPSDFMDGNFTASIMSAPEPGECLLFSLGLVGLLGFKRRLQRLNPSSK
jgi:hypothetical protein